jgi:hypothetical protein
MHRPTPLRLSGIAAVALFSASVAFAQTPTHIYELNGSLADSLGGPSLINNGATLGATGLTFGVNQGPTLIGALPISTYSIEMMFSLTTTDGYRKLIDFKDRTSDTGLYNISTSLQLYNANVSPSGNLFAANTPAHLIVTRDGATNQFLGYVNGNLVLTTDDVSLFGTFTGTSQIAHFFRDDLVNGSEASAGFLDFIRTYDTVLTQSQVTARYNSAITPATAAPEPSTFALVGFAALGMVGVVRRRRA